MSDADDLENAIAVNYWSISKVVLLDNNGATELAHLLLKDNDSEEITSVVLHPENASWLGWAMIGVAQGYINAMGPLGEEEDED